MYKLEFASAEIQHVQADPGEDSRGTICHRSSMVGDASHRIGNGRFARQHRPRLQLVALTCRLQRFTRVGSRVAETLVEFRQHLFRFTAEARPIICEVRIRLLGFRSKSSLSYAPSDLPIAPTHDGLCHFAWIDVQPPRQSIGYPMSNVFRTAVGLACVFSSSLVSAATIQLDYRFDSGFFAAGSSARVP